MTIYEQQVKKSFIAEKKKETVTYNAFSYELM